MVKCGAFMAESTPAYVGHGPPGRRGVDVVVLFCCGCACWWPIMLFSAPPHLTQHPSTPASPVTCPLPSRPFPHQAIRSAPDAASASAALQSPPFDLSKEQAEGVLGLTLRRLTSLEAAKLQEEQATLRAK